MTGTGLRSRHGAKRRGLQKGDAYSTPGTRVGPQYLKSRVSQCSPELEIPSLFGPTIGQRRAVVGNNASQ